MGATDDAARRRHQWARVGAARAGVVLAAVAVGGFAGPVAAAPPAAAAFFQPPSVIDAELSPQGTRLAITVAQKALGRVALVVIELGAAGLPARPVAVYRDADVADFHWVDDERLVYRIDDLQAEGGRLEFAPGLFTVRADGAEARQLVAHRGPRVVTETSFGRDPLTWNHELLHVPRAPEGAAGRDDGTGAQPGEVIVGHRTHDRDGPTVLTPRWLDTRTGQVRALRAGPVPEGARRWWFTPRGEPRLVLTVQGDRLAYHAYTAAGADGGEGSWRLLGEGTRARMPFAVLAVGADTLHVTRPAGAAGESVVVPFELARGRPGDEPLVETPGFDFDGELLHDRDGRLVGVRVHADAEQTVWLDDARRALQQAADRLLPGRVNRLSCRRCGEPDAVALVRSYSDTHPGELLLFTRADDRWRRVGEALPGIDPRQMAPTDFHRIAARDGRPLPLWLTGATPAADGRPVARPAVVLVHGGPWVRGGRWRWEPMRQFLASRGWVVIEPEFRGSAGYGQAHLRAGFRQWGQAMQDDVADALVWARAQGVAGDKACIIGASYGGYSTLMGLVRHPGLYRCGAAWVAVTDPLLFLEGAWWVKDDIPEAARAFSLKEMVGDPDDAADRARLLENSPLAQAAKIRAPLLLAWGDEDRRVPITHGRRLRDALREAGREPPEWIVYPGEAHGFFKPGNQVDFAERLARFLGRHLE